MKESFEPYYCLLEENSFMLSILIQIQCLSVELFIFRERKLFQGIYFPTISYIPPASQKSIALCSDKYIFDLTSEEQGSSLGFATY